MVLRYATGTNNSGSSYLSKMKIMGPKVLPDKVIKKMEAV